MKKTTKALTVSQQKELEEWAVKVKSGEARKITKDLILKNGTYDCDPRYTLDRASKSIIPKIHIEGKNISDLSEEELELISRLNIDCGLDNDLSMVEAVEARYRGLVMNLRRGLIKEYNCSTYSEKALVDMIIGAYARNLTYSKKLLCLKDSEYISSEGNGMMGIASKEIDRANRHFLTALETLRQLKQPSMNINVKTKNAFISQNQEFNKK
ncbi:MAG: hypothetical protein WC473_02935 [Patescibacteria group bacterium]|jgi:hypothetical protein